MNLAQHAAFGRLLAVIQIQQSVAFKLRMKRKGEQALFVLHMRSARGKIEESFGILRAGIARKKYNLSVLFDYDKAFGIIRDFFHPERAIEFEARESGCELERWQRVGRASSLKSQKERESEITTFGDVHARGK